MSKVRKQTSKGLGKNYAVVMYATGEIWLGKCQRTGDRPAHCLFALCMEIVPNTGALAGQCDATWYVFV